METKFCKYCQYEHPLTEEWWYFQEGHAPSCRVRLDKTVQNWRIRNAARIKEYNSLYQKTMPNEVKETRKKYKRNNVDSIQKQRKLYNKEHRQQAREYERERTRTDPSYKLGKRLRARVRHAIKNNQKTGSAVTDLGCTTTELKQYIESKFQEGMTWDNWSLHGWHIDHIVPLASFDLTDREQFLKACHYTNLQPLWAKDNLKKGDKVLT